MGSSAQAISYQNRETASAIRVETETGSHMFKISGYSLLKGIGCGNCYKSGTFTIGGYNWIIEYYPDGHLGHLSCGRNRICFFLRLEGQVTVKAQVTLTIVTQNGCPTYPSNKFYASELKTFKPSGCSSTYGSNLIYSVERSKFEASSFLMNDDAFTVKCTVTVVKRTHVEVINGATVPPLN